MLAPALNLDYVNQQYRWLISCYVLGVSPYYPRLANSVPANYGGRRLEPVARLVMRESEQ
jgi:hypothetical protein